MEDTPGQAQGETRADPFPDFPSFFGPAASEAVEVLKPNARLVCSGYICAFAVARARKLSWGGGNSVFLGVRPVVAGRVHSVCVETKHEHAR